MTATARLEEFCKDLSSLGLDVPIAFPGVEFNPPADGIWLHVRHFPTENEDIAWDDEAPFLVRGFFQVEVNYRHNQYGIFPASRLADIIVSSFKKGVPIADVAVSVQPSQAPEVVDDDRNFIPVTIQYYGTSCPE